MPLVSRYRGRRMKAVALHPYNREIVILNRWSIMYAPAYGWRRKR